MSDIYEPYKNTVVFRHYFPFFGYRWVKYYPDDGDFYDCEILDDSIVKSMFNCCLKYNRVLKYGNDFRDTNVCFLLLTKDNNGRYFSGWYRASYSDVYRVFNPDSAYSMRF